MKNLLILLFITVFIFSGTKTLSAQDLSPADAYYKDNIAVNDVNAESPFVNDSDDDDDPNKKTDGDSDWVGGPIEDAIVPILLAGIAYASFILVSKKRKSA